VSHSRSHSEVQARIQATDSQVKPNLEELAPKRRQASKVKDHRELLLVISGSSHSKKVASSLVLSQVLQT
jgi:hypothetical protein